MRVELLILSGLLAASLGLNAFWFWKFKKAPRAREQTYDCKELLSDLLAGSALVQVRRIAPADVLLRSPRDRG